jgi:deoxyadenosine/deoxycytidine kinase
VINSAPYIAVAGNIGAGKSSFLDFVTSRFAVEPVYEPNEENPFLAPFYNDMTRWAFHSQIFFLAAKQQIHHNLTHATGPIIQDRTIWEDAEIFAEQLYRTGHLSGHEYATYRRLYESTLDRIRPPDVLIYLRCPVKTLTRRIARRGRAMESGIPAAYLRALHELYEAWFERWNLSPKLVIQTDQMDPVTDLLAHTEVLDLMGEYLKRRAPGAP